MAERWFFFAFGLAVLTAGLVVGLRARHQERSASTTVIVLCLVPVLVRALFLAFPGLEFRFLQSDGYALLRGWWSAPFAIALFTAASPHMSSRLGRSGLVGLSLVLWVSGTDRLLATARFDPHSIDGIVDESGVCRQTTDYTCGAAAAATLLHAHGIASDEREMAEYCWTNWLTGTDELCVARGLRRKLAGTGLEPRVSLATWDELVAWNRPAAVTVKYKLFVDHWVVVLGIHGDRVEVGDPSDGRQVITKDEFLEMWKKRMVVLRPVEDDAAAHPR